MNDLFVFAEDVAQSFRVKEATAKKWIRSGRFGSPLKAGRHWAVTHADFAVAVEGMKKRIDGNGRPV